VSIRKSEYSFRGRTSVVPTCLIAGCEIIVVGRLLRVAMPKDEDWLELEPFGNPPEFLNALKSSGLRADIFSHAALADIEPRQGPTRYSIENVAAIRTDDYQAWWMSLPQETRKNTRRAAKKGIEIRSVTLDDALARGIKAIYDEMPIRQGRKFWHYNKDLSVVKKENGTYLDRSEFLGAFYLGELVGFIKFVRVGEAARIMQILSLISHQDKRPLFALIARAVEICHEKGLKYLIYGKLFYGNKTSDGVVEFKRRLGFEPMYFRRYYIPLTARGRFCLKLGLHAGLQGFLPANTVSSMLRVRAWWLGKTLIIRRYWRT
jgi:hypothetical protein